MRLTIDKQMKMQYIEYICAPQQITSAAQRKLPINVVNQTFDIDFRKKKMTNLFQKYKSS